MRKPLVASAGCLLLLAVALFVQHLSHRLDATTEQLRQTERRNAEVSEKLRALGQRARELSAQLASKEEENQSLRAAAKAAAAPASALTPPPLLTHAEVNARYEKARQLARSGDPAVALSEFLWCYDEGMRRADAFGGVRGSYLLSEIARLGEKYPLALEALRARRDQLLDIIVADPDEPGAFSDFSSLNHALKEDRQNLALFEKLPAGDRRREMFGLSVYELLTDARRYGEALEAQPYRDMSSLFDSLIEEPEPPANWSEERIAKVRSSIRADALKTAASNLEVLVGAGQLDQAREFAAKVLAYDSSEATRQSFREAAARAGRADFVFP